MGASLFVCPSTTGPGDCKNHDVHEAPHGCVHHSTSGVPDRHDKPRKHDS